MPDADQPDDPGSYRPGWLDRDPDWRDRYACMTRDDRSFFAKQWALAGGGPPTLDLSWLTFITIR